MYWERGIIGKVFLRDDVFREFRICGQIKDLVNYGCLV